MFLNKYRIWNEEKQGVYDDTSKEMGQKTIDEPERVREKLRG